MTFRRRYTRTRSTLLALLLAGTAAGVQAQSNTSGNLVGTAAAGDTVVVESVDTGFHREVTADAKGKFRLRALPVGTYQVKVRHADGREETLRPVAVRLGTTTRVTP